jgi:signal transduction histidine kinase
MRERKFFWRAPALRGAIETWGIGFAVLALLSSLAGQVAPAVLGNGALVLCGAAGTWAVLRLRLPPGSWRRQVLWEAGVAAILGIVMAVGLVGPAHLLGWQAVWEASSYRSSLTLTLLLLGVGPGYLATRGLLRLGFYWNHLRRRRMVWSLTHALLTLVVVVSSLMLLAPFVLGILRYSSYGSGYAESLGVLLAERFFRTLFPAAMVVVVVGMGVLLIVLPPSFLFSYLVARRTTRRLEKLAAATGALRAGDYGTRVPVEGEDEVARLQADFNAMAGELEQALEKLAAERDKVAALLRSRRDLVADVSHELRTPLATLRGYLESLQAALEAGSPPESLARDLQVMSGEVLRLGRLIDDLFSLSQAEVDGLELAVGPVDVGGAIRRQVAALAPLAWERERVEIVADLPANLPPACVDAGRLEQILVNLLRNGLRHTPPGGIVAVVAAAQPGQVRIDVRDTGQGIPPQELPHVWERFYRGEGARACDEHGAGLGLAVVKDLTQAMGGRVAVESAPGEGAVFSVWLPRCEA